MNATTERRHDGTTERSGGHDGTHIYLVRKGALVVADPWTERWHETPATFPLFHSGGTCATLFSRCTDCMFRSSVGNTVYFIAVLSGAALCWFFGNGGSLPLRSRSRHLGETSPRQLRRLDVAGPYVGYEEDVRRGVVPTTRRRLGTPVGMQIHVAYGVPTVSTMVVSWANGAATSPAPRSTLRYSENEQDIKDGHGRTSHVVCEAPSTYNYTSSFTKPPFPPASVDYRSPWMHHCTVSMLTPNTRYYYEVGPYAGSGATPPTTPYSFRTARAPGDDGKGTLTVAVVGDLGQTHHSERTRDAVKTSMDKDPSVQFGFIVGDMSYADGTNPRWDTYGNTMEPLMANFPMHVMVGNHEIEVDKDTKIPFLPYRYRYRMPGTLPEKTGPMSYFPNPDPTKVEKYYDLDATYEGGSSYYSFSSGYGHFIALNAYNTHDTSESSAQYKFLENDLKSVDRTITPWVFVFLHCPLHQSNKIHQVSKEMNEQLTQKWAEPLFKKYNVDMVLAGHVHAYQRTKRIPTGTGPVYITIGDGGNHEKLYDQFSPESWSAYHNGEHYGSGQIRILNEKEVEWVWRANPDPNTKQEEDSVTLVRQANGSNKVVEKPDSMGGWYFGIFFVVALVLVCGVLAWNAREQLFGSKYGGYTKSTTGGMSLPQVDDSGAEANPFQPPSLVVQVAATDAL